jgi:hypothetical protein
MNSYYFYGKDIGGRPEEFHSIVRDFTQTVFGPHIAKDSPPSEKVEVGLAPM